MLLQLLLHGTCSLHRADERKDSKDPRRQRLSQTGQGGKKSNVRQLDARIALLQSRDLCAEDGRQDVRSKYFTAVVVLSSTHCRTMALLTNAKGAQTGSKAENRTSHAEVRYKQNSHTFAPSVDRSNLCSK